MSGDHKRKSRAIAPAVVTVGDACVTIVIPDVLGKNEAHVAGRDGARHTSPATKRYRESVRVGLEQAFISAVFRHRFSDGDDGPLICKGAWRIEVLGVWPTQNLQVGFKAPRGDCDAPISAVLDALQRAGALDDDARIVEVWAWNIYRRGVRCTVAKLWRVYEDERQEQYAERLMRLVPPAVETETKPRTQRKKKV